MTLLQGAIRTSAASAVVRPPQPLSTSNRSPLLSPRCLSPAPAAAMRPPLAPCFTCSASRVAELVTLVAAPSVVPASPAPLLPKGGPSSSNGSSNGISSGSNNGSTSTIKRRTSFDDAYDSAVPMCVADSWERVQEDLGIFEPPGSDPQEWEEMVSLLSFDGEEHKRVMRQMHGANARVEDMFASFDGDDFEQVMRAARGEVPSEPEPPADAAAAAAGEGQQQDLSRSNSSSSSNGSSNGSSSLYKSVCALRAAAMAAEAARKSVPGLRRRKVPLNDTKSADAWMLQVPYTVAAATPEQQQQQQQLVGYIGMSCDSSSDGGSSSSSDGCYSADHAASIEQHSEQQTVLPVVSVSNNIVSSRNLRSKVSQQTPVVAAAAAAPARAAGGSAATAVALEPAVVTLTQPTVTAAVPAVAALEHIQQQLAPARQQGLQGVQYVTAEPQQQQMQQQQRVESPGAQRWCVSSTRGIRRALARLHGAQLGGLEF